MPAPPPIARYAGNPSELSWERERLQEVLSLLDKYQHLAERTQPAASDQRGEVLKMVLAWRRQRRRALAAEIERLGRAIAAADGGGMGRKTFAGEL